MKKNSIILVSLTAFMFVSCTSQDTDEKLATYINDKCVFSSEGKCFLDLKEVFKVDYDTMYIFTEYTQLNGVRLILSMPEYNCKNILLPTGFIVEDSQRKIILIKNHKIVYEDDIKTPYFDNGIVIKKLGQFDGEPYTHIANIFTSSKFLVLKKSPNFYIFRNVLSDSSILKRDTISL